MSEFKSDLITKHLELSGKESVLLYPFEYQSDRLEKTVEVPSGFITDFASTPRLPIVYWIAGNIGQEAAVIHDYLYQTHLYGITRRQADLVFMEAMKVMGIKLWRREIMYAAVRAGGFFAYRSGPNRYRQLNVKTT